MGHKYATYKGEGREADLPKYENHNKCCFLLGELFCNFWGLIADMFGKAIKKVIYRQGINDARNKND